MRARKNGVVSRLRVCFAILGEFKLNVSNIIRVAWFTFFQAACSTLTALLIGLPAAFFCGRRRFFGRKFLLSLSAVPFCVPPLIIALGYVTFLGINGGLNKFLTAAFGFEKPPVKILYSFFGIIIAHGFYNFPLIMKNVSQVWEALPVEQAESARLLGANEFRIFRTVTIFQLIPSILSSCLLVFIYCFLSFVLILLFGGIGNSTLEVEIYKATRATLDFKTAGIFAIIETAILCAVTIFYCVLEEKISRAKGIRPNILNASVKLGGAENKIAEILIFCVLIFAIFLFFLAPLAGIVYNAFASPKNIGKLGRFFSLNSFKRIFNMKSFVPSVVTAIKVGFFTGFFCAAIGFLYSAILKFSEGKTKKCVAVILKIFPMLPMSVSSVVVGVFITLIVRNGNVFCLAIAQISLTWPLAFRVIYPQLQKIQNQTLDAAKMISKNKFQIIFRIFLPVCKNAVLSAFGFCFAMSVGDATLPLVLAIPKFDTLSLFTYRLAGAYRFNEACASGLFLALICVALYFFSGVFGRRAKKS